MIFVLVGSEALLLKRALEKLLSDRVDSASRDFNFDIFEGGAIDVRKVADAIGTFPVFIGARTAPSIGQAAGASPVAPRRVVLIRNAHELKKGESDRLAELLSKIPETTDLIITAEKSDGRTAFWQAVSKAAKVREFKPLDSREAPRWITEEAAQAGYRIRFEAAQWIAAAVGSDLTALQSTLEKLYLLKGDQKEITLADVESAVTAVSWKNIFELTESVGVRNLGRALDLFRKMEESGESPIAMISLLGRHFRILSKVKEGDSAGVSPYFLGNYQKQAGQFDAGRLAEKREKIFQADWALKSSPIDSNLLFERLLMDLCR